MTTIERIKKISKERGWSLQKVAEKAGIGINSIYRWNTKTPSTASLQAVAKVLGVSVDYLLGKNETPDWANEKDTTDLKRFLEDNDGSFTYGGDNLTEDEKEKLRIAMTQIFWDRHKHD
ncbi:helix-turn-helix domain-containing protein [Pediococcus pentosaceus]|uniref:helix-turn-helix domain-containing protein n=1 Tax=Pediococcus pentosaceus TaxID=1255 RepID=UPI0018A1A494|nr:helix-turn-helix transcriptional regulator [Pediococcus pentosaceus]MBF7137993.1 helix-turn-helix transcriptional regulator [Pediococcus pentosaceus]